MADFYDFARREIAGLRAILDKAKPLEKCRDKKTDRQKNHRWATSAIGKTLVKTNCKVCGVPFRRPSRLAKDTVAEISTRLQRLEEIIQKRPTQ